MEVKRGNIAIVAHGEFGRPRPGIIVQADELGDDTTTVLACPLSSDLSDFPNPRLRPIIEPAVNNGLRIRSQIMTDKLTAMPRGRVRQVIGTIDTETRDRLDTALLLVLGLAR
jgi:mRNA interferase MazF